MVTLLYFLVQNSGQPLQGCVFVATGAVDVEDDVMEKFPESVVEDDVLTDPVRNVTVSELVDEVTVALLAIELREPDEDVDPYDS